MLWVWTFNRIIHHGRNQLATDMRVAPAAPGVAAVVCVDLCACGVRIVFAIINGVGCVKAVVVPVPMPVVVIVVVAMRMP